jgi:hypothetical protein
MAQEKNEERVSVAADYLHQLKEEGTWTAHKEDTLAKMLAVMYAGKCHVHFEVSIERLTTFLAGSDTVRGFVVHYRQVAHVTFRP